MLAFVERCYLQTDMIAVDGSWQSHSGYCLHPEMQWSPQQVNALSLGGPFLLPLKKGIDFKYPENTHTLSHMLHAYAVL